MTEIEKKALAYLGLAVRAGRVTVGVPLICEALKKGAKERTPLVVLEASDTSENTHKRISDRTGYYKVLHVRLSLSSAALAAAIGKAPGVVAAVGVCEPNLAGSIASLYKTIQ
jgi:ribosomal protein L7Ae-like RNA K-turn-binding protein